MKEITFELTTPFNYSNGSGNQVEASFITLQEPTGKVSHLCCDIESLIQSGIMSMSGKMDNSVIEEAKEAAKEAKKDEPGDESGPNADSILTIMSSGGVDMRKVVATFRELFKEVGLMGGEKPLTKPRMDDMSHKDFKKMMGEYASNFIMN